MANNSMDHVSTHFIAVKLICSGGKQVRNKFGTSGKDGQLEWREAFGGFMFQRIGRDRNEVLDQGKAAWNIGLVEWARVVKYRTMESEFT